MVNERRAGYNLIPEALEALRAGKVILCIDNYQIGRASCRERV